MNRYLLILLFVCLLFSQVLTAQENTSKTKNSKELITDVLTDFQAGKYQDAIDTLLILEQRLKKGSKKYDENMGLINYWRGMSYARLNDYQNAEIYLEKAIELKYNAVDLYYEFGQVLYVADRLKKARIAFKKSFKQGYKKGVSLYYIAFISQELNDHKKAVSFYSMIEKLPLEERKDVIQAARMQIGDIYLHKIEKLPDSFKDVEKYVIPQYQKALNFNEESPLADQIKEKIEALQRKYELVLFRMRNGRPTNRPPYYLRGNLLYGTNDNVTASSEDAKASLSKNDYASNYYTAGLFGRYSIYANSAFSYAPEFSLSKQTYTSPSSNIYGLDNYSVGAALKMNYEHIYNENQATFFIDFGYTYKADGADGATESKKKLAYSDTTTSVTLSEELQIWKNNPSTFRYQYSQTTDDTASASFSNSVMNWEQIVGLGRTTLFFFNSFNMKTMKDSASEASNTNTFTSRLDAIFPTFFGLFNPTVYTSITSTNYIKDSDKGVTSLTTYGLNMNRPLNRKFYLTMDISQASQTGKVESDKYKQQVVTLNLDYIY